MEPLAEINSVLAGTEPVPLVDALRDFLVGYAFTATAKARPRNVVRLGPDTYDRAKKAGLLKVIEVRFPELTMVRG